MQSYVATGTPWLQLHVSLSACVCVRLSRTFSAQHVLTLSSCTMETAASSRARLLQKKKKKPGRQPNCTQALNTPLFTHTNTNMPWSACAESILCLFDLKLQGFFCCYHDGRFTLKLHWSFFVTTQTLIILGNGIYSQKTRGTFYIFFVTPSLNDPSVYIHHHVLWPP